MLQEIDWDFHSPTDIKKTIKQLVTETIPSLKKRLQFSVDEQTLANWVLNHHGIDLLDEAIENKGKEMFGGLPLRIRLFTQAGRMDMKSFQGRPEYVEEVVYHILQHIPA